MNCVCSYIFGVEHEECLSNDFSMMIKIECQVNFSLHLYFMVSVSGLVTNVLKITSLII